MTERGNETLLAQTWVLPALVVTLMAACAPISAQQLAQGIDPARRHWYGEFYNIAEYERCVTKTNDRRNTQCEYLRLTRVEEPEFWPYPEVPKPKLPEPPNPPVYQPGMTSEQYFKALCEKEAGEFIYKTVDNVEGIYQIRPRKKASWDALFDRYVMEDPYGYTETDATEPAFVYVARERYQFLEVASASLKQPPTGREYRDASLFDTAKINTRFARYFGYDNRQMKSMKLVGVGEFTARYGFLWRGIPRPQDRILGIAGGEFLVVDLKSGEILGIRRGFARSGFVRNSRSGIQWETAEVCPRLRRQADGWDKSGDFSAWFITKVLKPVGVDTTRKE